MTISCIKVNLPYDVYGPTDLDQVEIRIRGAESIARFKKLISRALNTFADAHPELKELGDILEHGKPLQDYYSQRSDIKLNIPAKEKPMRVETPDKPEEKIDPKDSLAGVTLKLRPDPFAAHPYGTENPE